MGRPVETRLRSLIGREAGTLRFGVGLRMPPAKPFFGETSMAKVRPTKSQGGSHRRMGKKWVQNVKTVSTFPPKDLFTKDAATIARAMESKKVSPKGIGSGIRMIQYFINRGGKGLSAVRKRELEKAKQILQEKRLTQHHAG
jgi:Protein of unknown function (DUF3175)